MKNLIFTGFILLASISLKSQLTVNAGNDVILCNGVNTLQLNAMVTGGTPPYTYKWTALYTIGSQTLYASHFLTDTTLANPMLINLRDNVTLWITVTDASLSTHTDSVIIQRSVFNVESSDDSRTINQGDTVEIFQQLTSNLCPCIYAWSPSYGLSDSTTPNPLAFPDRTTYYEFTITDKGGCTETAQDIFEVFVTPLAINELKSSVNSVTLYPTPTKDLLNLEIRENLNILEITLYNLLGEKIKNYNPNERTLSIKGVRNGQYLLKIQAGNQVITKRVLVE